jgi:hypothetical protein
LLQQISKLIAKADRSNSSNWGLNKSIVCLL